LRELGIAADGSINRGRNHLLDLLCGALNSASTKRVRWLLEPSGRPPRFAGTISLPILKPIGVGAARRLAGGRGRGDFYELSKRALKIAGCL
jgi:hypothetical protein